MVQYNVCHGVSIHVVGEGYSYQSTRSVHCMNVGALSKRRRPGRFLFRVTKVNYGVASTQARANWDR